MAGPGPLETSTRLEGTMMNLHGFMLAALATTLCAISVWADFPPVDKLPPHPELPDPLVMLDGTRVATKEDWVHKRRPELKSLFQHYMYGTFPPRPAKMDFQVGRVDPKALGGKATL